MKTKGSSISSQSRIRYVLTLCACAVLALGMFGLAACTSSGDDATNTNNEQTTDAQDQSSDNAEELVEEQVTGTITEIGDTELLIDASADSNEFLQGDVRVDFSQIESNLVGGLNVGDEIVVTYSGQVGMSEPPFISAISIILVEVTQ